MKNKILVYVVSELSHFDSTFFHFKLYKILRGQMNYSAKRTSKSLSTLIFLFIQQLS